MTTDAQEHKPVCSGCGAHTFTFREIHGPVSVVNARDAIIRDAEEAAGPSLHRQEEEAVRLRGHVAEQAREEKARLSEWVKAQTEATATWRKAELTAADQDYRDELRRIEAHYQKARGRQVD